MLRALVIGILIVLPASASAATDLILKIDGVPGESKIIGHENEIDVVSFAWGVGPNDARRPATCPTELTINKLFDAASPALALAALTKQRFSEAQLVVRKGADKPVEYVTVTMSNVGVARYQTGGAETDAALMESADLSFTAVTVTYFPVKLDGTLGDPKSFTYESTKPCLKN
jgi:type VI secretion system secreted protein Hcp